MSINDIDWVEQEAALEAAAKARATYVWCEDSRKSVHAELMEDGRKKQGIDKVNAQEAYAYRHPKYKEHLDKKRAALEQYENLRMKYELLTLKISVWQSLAKYQSTNR